VRIALGPETRRILIAAALSAVVLIVWQKFFMPPAPVKGVPDGGVTAPRAGGPPAPLPAEPSAPLPEAAPVAAPEELATLETPAFAATFTSHGGALKSFVLKGRKYQREAKGKEEQVDLVKVVAGEPYPLAVIPSPELGGPAEPAADGMGSTPMKLVGKDARSVTFEGRVGAVGVRKRFTVSDRPFEIEGEVSVFGADRGGAFSLVYSSWEAPDAPKPGFFTGGEVFEVVTPFCRGADKTVRYNGKDAVEKVAGTAAWVGLDQHYFVSAVIPARPTGECLLVKGRQAGAAAALLRVPVSGATTIDFKLFAGPKKLDLLRTYGRDFDTAIDYGGIANFFSFFARILLWLMQKFHAVAHNWGIAIILLTVFVKVLLYPLTKKSMQSMQEMRRVQPEVDKLKAKYGADKEKLNQAVMQLYQQHKVNPLGGCLPMLLQLPIWFALYATLQTSVELYREPFLWIHDLTRFDPFYVLPITMGISSFVMQKIQPQPADSAQAKMLLYFMPIFFTFIMLRLPAGLTLYILVNNLLSIAQQQWMLRPSKTEPAKS